MDSATNRDEHDLSRGEAVDVGETEKSGAVNQKAAETLQ
jgi:hypothetical protein